MLKGMRIARHGALAVVETAHPKDYVQRLLKQLDDRLFLEKQITLANEEVWCVVVSVGSEIPPVTLLEWRDENGRPIPYLSERLVSRVAQFERDYDKLRARVVDANSRLVAEKRRQADAAYEEIASDMAPRLKGLRSSVLPRGQHLRRSRDKGRSRGEKL
jgi:hypothetical protein